MSFPPHNPVPAPDAERGKVPRRICIADDDSTTRIMLAQILTKLGYEVIACPTGDQAFESLADLGGPRLALLDWMMPGLDGIKICQRLRSELPGINYYLILVTARTNDDDVISALRKGADDFVSKPFSPHILQARIEVGFRTLDLQQGISDYASRMQQLAESRAAQLVHADRMASLGLLSASVAHEINNPASFLSVNVQTLRENWPALERIIAGEASKTESVRALALAKEMPMVLAEMEEGISRIRQITSELRSFSRSGKGEPVLLSVEESLRKALRMCSVRLKASVEVILDAADLPMVLADATRLEQVFVNLVLNSADAMEDCPVRQIHIKATLEKRGIRLRFDDTGPGIAPGQADALFRPFFTTKPSEKGTGLGLYISRNLIEDFGGTLALVPSSRGARFEINLPLPESPT